MKTNFRMPSLARSRYLEGILLGICASCFALFLIFLLVDTQIRGPLRGHLSILVTAIVTLLAAYLALRGISAQIQSNVEIEISRQQSQLEAARASLPLALSEINDVCRRAIIFTYRTDRHAEGAANASKLFVMPENALTVLKECITYSDISVACRLANVIRHYQVAYSRTVSSYEEPSVIKYQFTNTFDWAVVLLLLEDCYPFSRGSSDIIPAKITSRSLSSIFMFFNDPNLLSEAKFMDEVNRRDKLTSLEVDWDQR